MTVQPVVTLRRLRPWHSITIPLADGTPVTTGGNGGWELVGRPKRTALTDWIGHEPLRQVIPCVFDGHQTARSVEPDLMRLGVLYVRQPDRDRPSVVKIAGPLGSPLDWVIESIEWGDAIRRSADGQRTRQFFTLNMLQYVAADVVTRRATTAAGRAAERLPTSSNATRTVTVASRAGSTPESLLVVAARELGDATRWREIADLNGLTYPGQAKAGQALRIPQ